ncbi:MAG: polysaccharide pyruvyl transferase family protein [Aureliella sp.]
MKTSSHAQTKVSLFGASPDTGNQGVNALHDSTLSALAKRGVGESNVFAFTSADREPIRTKNGKMDVRQVAAFRTKRFYKPQSFAALRRAMQWNGSHHVGAASLRESNAVLDLSAGDSFTDLYGWERFRAVLEPKLLAIRYGIPLILLPQTIGPFESPKAKRIAARVLKHARQVWARDQESYELLQDMVGDSAVEGQLRRGVDLAFLLEPRRPQAIPDRIEHWIQREKGVQPPVIGLNVSGLVFNEPARAKRQFKLKTNYRRTVTEFVTWCTETTSAKIVLVPHVQTDSGSIESDYDAAAALLHELPAEARERVAILPTSYSASELKWLIGQMDWFCGTRMHSTIAALSSGVPVASLAYSMKTQGVFSQCGLARQVFELRELDTRTAVRLLKRSFLERMEVRTKLHCHLPGVLQKAEQQMDVIVEACRRGRMGRMVTMPLRKSG